MAKSFMDKILGKIGLARAGTGLDAFGYTNTATYKDLNPHTGLVSGNYWQQTGMPWVASQGRKAVRACLV